MSSSESAWDAAARQSLLGLARASVEHGLREGEPLPVDEAHYPPALRALRAAFVTLRLRGELRGCTGTLEAVHPLVVEVARTAHRSAFRDPRFPPLERSELAELAFHISILSPLETLVVESEAGLLERLRPGVDGLVLREGSLTGTFLPAVWSHLPSPAEFVRELKRKAGLPLDHWSATLVLQRYTVDEIG